LLTAPLIPLSTTALVTSLLLSLVALTCLASLFFIAVLASITPSLSL
jgi:hypothetical protein